MRRYGLVAMSAKPFHRGHMAAVERASSQCDEVRLFVSLGDRVRPGEVPVLGADMEIIWKTQLEGIMPGNVAVEYVKVPVAAAYDFAARVEESGEVAEVAFYADQEDLDKNFPAARMAKYFPRLSAEGLVSRVPTARLFSGTEMRRMLASGDEEGFKAMLPDGVDGDAVWELLRASAQKPPATKPKKKRTKREALRPSLSKLILG